jgi:hypothetical protein
MSKKKLKKEFKPTAVLTFNSEEEYKCPKCKRLIRKGHRVDYAPGRQYQHNGKCPPPQKTKTKKKK